MKKALIIGMLSVFFSSCFPAYKIYPIANRKHKLPVSYTKTNVYVANRDSFPDEFKILKYSKLYQFSDDSSTITKIKLYPLEFRGPTCGNPMIGSMLTVGVLPSQFPNQYRFKYDITKNGNKEEHALNLKIAQHLWLLNIFSNKKNFKKQAGIAIRAQASR